MNSSQRLQNAEARTNESLANFEGSFAGLIARILKSRATFHTGLSILKHQVAPLVIIGVVSLVAVKFYRRSRYDLRA